MHLRKNVTNEVQFHKNTRANFIARLKFTKFITLINKYIIIHKNNVYTKVFNNLYFRKYKSSENSVNAELFNNL